MKELITKRILEMKDKYDNNWQFGIDINTATNLELLEIYDVMSNFIHKIEE